MEGINKTGEASMGVAVDDDVCLWETISESRRKWLVARTGLLWMMPIVCRYSNPFAASARDTGFLEIHHPITKGEGELLELKLVRNISTKLTIVTGPVNIHFIGSHETL